MTKPTDQEIIDMITAPKKTLTSFSLPLKEEKVTLGAIGIVDNKEYKIDISRGKIAIDVYKTQQRHRNIQLFRIDIGSSQCHANPDGRKLGPRHVHVYTEKYNTRLAYDLDSPKDVQKLCTLIKADPVIFKNLTDLKALLRAFTKACNLTITPEAQPRLF